MRKLISSKQVVTVSFLIDVADLVLNSLLAFVSGSMIMLAEALQGGVDLLTSGLLLVGLKQSTRRANKQHQFGYGREIYFWTLMSGLLMLTLTAGSSIYFGLSRILHPEIIEHTQQALAILLLGACTNGYAFWLSYRRLHEQHPQQKIWRTLSYSDLLETKTTFILDSMGTLAAISGLISLGFYVITGDSRYDGMGAVIIGLMIAILSYFLIIEIKDLLVGRSADPETELRIVALTEEFKDVHKVLDLRTMYLGTQRLLVNLEIHVQDSLSTTDIEQLVDRIKHKIKKTIPSVKHIQIEIESD